MRIETQEMVQDHLTHFWNLSPPKEKSKREEQRKGKVLCQTQGSMLDSKHVHTNDKQLTRSFENHLNPTHLKLNLSLPGKYVFVLSWDSGIFVAKIQLFTQ